jgi:phage gp29-like protein
MFGELASYFNRLKSKLVIGQESTTEAIGGGHAVSQEQNLVREDIRDADAVLLSATLQDQLVAPWTAVNYGPDVDPPVLTLEYVEPDDLKATLDAAFGIADRGGRVSVQQLRDKAGLVEPQDGDEVLGAASGGAGGAAGGAPPLQEPTPGEAVNRAKPSWLRTTTVPRIEAALNAASAAKRAQEIEDQLEAALAEAGQPVVDGWLKRIKEAFNSATSIEDFAGKMMDLYPDLEVATLTTVMGQAMALANVAGRDLDA